LKKKRTISHRGKNILGDGCTIIYIEWNMTLLAQTLGDKKGYSYFITALCEVLLLMSFKDFDVVRKSKRLERSSIPMLLNAKETNLR